MGMETLDLKSLLNYQRKKSIRFSEFIEGAISNPEEHFQTSASLIKKAIEYFGFEIVVRSGEPIISYNIFKDLFSTGINAVFGQEHCIKYIVDVITSFDNEAGSNRGIVLVGPPASGKTNIVDLIVRALEEYTKEHNVKLYTFCFKFASEKGCSFEMRSQFHHNPLLLIPITMQTPEGSNVQPRQRLFEFIKRKHQPTKAIKIPSFYLNATLDKRTLDIIEGLMQNPINKNLSLYEVLEKYTFVEEIEFSTPQAKGISNIDDTSALKARVNPIMLDNKNTSILNEHLPGKSLYNYSGAIVDSNRGILHIHDAFGLHDGSHEKDYKPLLMLLGSGKVAIESTQATVDNAVVITTNIEEMKNLDKQLDASKLLDRIERIPVNYLLDANSEMDILRRDMSNMREEYDVDPNLLRVAAYYAVLTRLLPPVRKSFPPQWSEEKRKLYRSITPEQKLLIYSSQNEDPIRTISQLPHWHPFRNEMLRLGLSRHDTSSFADLIVSHPNAINLKDAELFTNEELKLIDDEFMRHLWNEHYPDEGKSGISVRQLQNVMRNTISNSDGRKIHVGIFLKQLAQMIEEGPDLHHWMTPDEKYQKDKPVIPFRMIGYTSVETGAGDYGDYNGMVDVVRKLYFAILKKELTICTVDRNPGQIEHDLRKYIQYALLNGAIQNKAFAHIMVPKFSFVDPQKGLKVDRVDEDYMKSIEMILAPGRSFSQVRNEISQKFLDFQSSGEVQLEEGKNIISSRKDSILQCFAKEYSVLLSHRKVDGEINPEQLKNAFFHKKNDPKRLPQYPAKVKDFMKNIIHNMNHLYKYSTDVALDTVVFALRKNILKFDDILS
jgi:predicted Ser/Thr protein kinase